MKQTRNRLTYANVMSSIAVFLVLGGATAFAATELGKNTVGSKQLKKNAVVAAKIKNNAVGSAKLANGAVTNGKLAGDAVSSDKIAAGAVTSGKLAGDAVNSEKIAANSVTAGKVADGAIGASKLTEAERSQAFISPTSASTQALDTNLFGSYTPAQSVTSLTLPAGRYVVTAQSEFINTDTALEYTSIHSATCRLLDDGAEVTEQSVTVQPGLLVPTGGVNVVGLSDGGQLNLACRQGASAKLFAYKAKIIATRVGSVTGP